MTPRLTLNLGLRYEYLRPFQDKYNKLANFDLDTDPLHPATGAREPGRKVEFRELRLQ